MQRSNTSSASLLQRCSEHCHMEAHGVIRKTDAHVSCGLPVAQPAQLNALLNKNTGSQRRLAHERPSTSTRPGPLQRAWLYSVDSRLLAISRSRAWRSIARATRRLTNKRCSSGCPSSCARAWHARDHPRARESLPGGLGPTNGQQTQQALRTSKALAHRHPQAYH